MYRKKFSERLSENQKERIDKIIDTFEDISSTVWVYIDEDKEEGKKALDKIEEAKFWTIKSIL